MLYLLIITSIILFFIILWFILKLSQNKKNKIKNIEINFQDIDALNVSKILIEDNDIDFTRNELWFQYKQKQIINLACFNILKKKFEEQSKIQISNWNPKDTENKWNTFQLIEIITSDNESNEEIADAFYLLEQKIK